MKLKPWLPGTEQIDREIEKMKQTMSAPVPVPARPSGKKLAKLLLSYADDPGYAYAVLSCALREIKNENPSLATMENISLAVTTNLHGREVDGETAAIAKDIFTDEGLNMNPATEAAKQIIGGAVVDMLRHENEKLEMENKSLTASCRDKDAEITRLLSTLKASREKLAKAEEKIARDAKSHDKAIREMEHRLIEMERENQKISKD